MAMRVGAMTDPVLICVNCSAVTGKLAQALETLALEVEKKRRMLGAILRPGEHLESPWGAACKPQAVGKGVMFAFWRLGGRCSGSGPAGRGAQGNVPQGTKSGSSVL